MRRSLHEILDSMTESYELSGVQDKGLEIVGPAHYKNPKPFHIHWNASSQIEEKVYKGVSNSLTIVNPETDIPIQTLHSNSFLRVGHPKLTFARVVNRFFSKASTGVGIHHNATISDEATIESPGWIGPNVVVEKAIIRKGHCLVGNSFIYNGCELGENIIVHAGCTLGSPGSGFVKDEQGQWLPFPQIGGLTIGSDVEIGANTYINRGALGNTEIGMGVKIGLSCCIGHNVIVGKNSMVLANSVLAGSSVIEENVFVSIGVTIRNGIRIGKGATVGMGSVVVKDVEPGSTVLGVPARRIK